MHSSEIKGHWFVKCYGPDGILKDKREGDNTVCTNGKDLLALFLNSASTSTATWTCKYIGVGTDSTGEAAADTALGGELLRQTGTLSYLSGGIWRVTATFSTGAAAGNVAEYGLFSSSANGTLFCRDTESTIAVGANDTLTVVAQITFS